MSVYYECCVLSGRGLCDQLITLRKESYRLWCVVVCDLETSRMRRSWPTGDCRVKNKQTAPTMPTQFNTIAGILSEKLLPAIHIITVNTIKFCVNTT
jgi:hypothetical protein